MARKSKSVAKHQILEIAASLKAKAAIPITVTLEATISELAPQIQAMLDAGYTYADVAEVFKSHGVELAASSIKSYHRKQIQSPQTNVTKQESSGSELPLLSTPAQTSKNEQVNLQSEQIDDAIEQDSADEPSDGEQINHSSDEDSDGEQINHSSDNEDSDDAEIDLSVDELASSVLNQNAKTAKSKFNVPDRSKL
jgi:hypothetical protein